LQSSPNKAEKYMQKRFGIQKNEINLEKINGDYWHCPETTSGLETKTRGIRAVRDMEIGLKPTTYFLQLIQNKITKSKTEITKKELKAFNQDEMIQRKMNKKGYIAIIYENQVIGCGFYMDQLISSRIPEGRLKELVESL
jgi:NOL1/NOP2/fmu family ribosome biogenesis protein